MPASAINKCKRQITDKERIFSMHIINKILVSLQIKVSDNPIRKGQLVREIDQDCE